MSVEPFRLKDAPALIEHIFPSQKISAEAYKEQMAGSAKTLTALGSYWKGRKPLVLNRAVILASLLQATDDPEKDLEVFEALMGIDDVAFDKRLPKRSPLRDVIAETPYEELVKASERAENVANLLDDVWDRVNSHVGTTASSLQELVEQLGIMRFGHVPRFADVFSGSGQIPFEAARLGLDTYASDLNPVACMLTWGAFNVVGASEAQRRDLQRASKEVTTAVQEELDWLGVEADGTGWTAKVFLYCLEVTCPESGWKVPLLPSRVISVKQKVIARLIPKPTDQRYDIKVVAGVSNDELEEATTGTIQKEGRGAESFVVHSPDDSTTYRVPYTRIRDGRPATPGGAPAGLRSWERNDIAPRPSDTLQERLYAILWQKAIPTSKRFKLEYRAVTADDLSRELTVLNYVQEHLAVWQEEGYVPSMRIEPGAKTDEPIRTRGWTHWHHLFTPRQLLVLGLLFKQASQSDQYARLAFGLGRVLDYGSRLSRWDAGSGKQQAAFYNQALNTFYNYATRAFPYLDRPLSPKFVAAQIHGDAVADALPAEEHRHDVEVAVTDPPYGDAVNYEEILEYFIAWFQKNPPKEFAHWTWDSRRALAIKGEDHDFKKSMIDAYANLANHMPDNGIQVLMFTHQSGTIWSDMASIVWGAGLRVTAAWYVTTETNSALRQGAYVKGTVLLVLRKRTQDHATFQDDLAYELETEVKTQVHELVGLNQSIKSHSTRGENTFNDADLQMAGYAAALRVLTNYRTIDGRDMIAEAKRPRTKGKTTLVDNLIDFAVNIANSALIPEGLSDTTWNKLNPTERFYLKMLQQESHGIHTLDAYQQFAKAFRVRDSQAIMASTKANKARLKTSNELGRSEMNETSELGGTPLRAILFAMHQLANDADRDKVLTGLRENTPNYYNQRDHIRTLARHLHHTLHNHQPNEAEHARLIDLFIMNEGV